MTAPIDLSGAAGQVISRESFANLDRTAIYLFDCHDITIRGCTFSNVASAVIAVGCSGIVVEDNTAINLTGPASGEGKGNFVQLDKCSAGSGTRVVQNRVTNTPGQSDPEDLVSVYKSNGTAALPILVASNILKGGGPSTSGSGIMVGDGGGSHIRVEANLLVDTGNVGIGVAGGSNILVHGNRITSRQTAVSNVGLYVWDQSGLGSSGITVRHNRVWWVNSAGAENHAWDAGNAGTVSGWADNAFGGPVPRAAILAAL